VRVKTFQGRTLEDVLPEIRAELGGNAVVLGQRQVVHGGVGGFFGKRMVEVTAADRMPSDTELIELEDRIMGRSGDAPDSSDHQQDADAAPERRGRHVDLVDTWDPQADQEIPDHVAAVLRNAQKVTEAAAAVRDSVGYQPITPPRRSATIANALAAYEPEVDPTTRAVELARAAIARPVNSAVSSANMHHDSDSGSEERAAAPVMIPAQESAFDRAQRLASEAHQAIAAATREINDQTSVAGNRTITLSVNEPARVEEPSAITLRAQIADPAEPLESPESAREEDVRDEDVRASHPDSTSPNRGAAQAPRIRTRDDQGVRAGLFAAGVDEDVADVILNQLALHRIPFTSSDDIRALTRELVAETLRVETGWPALGRTHRIAFVGASGAGKSSVVAKLAEGYQRSDMRVGVVSIIAGATTRAQLAAHVNDPLIRRGTADIQFAGDPAQMITAMERFSDRDVVLIDTPSSSYLDQDSYRSVASCLAAVRIDDVQAVLPLALSVREAASVIDHFRPLGVKHMVVTKLDESRYAGQLLNFGFRFGVPITFLTDGPRVPEDIRAASVQEMATLIVPHHDQGDIAT
jgi:flagellar biosynthesis GTPase FlhF